MRSEHGVRLWKKRSIGHCSRRARPTYIGIFYSRRFLEYIQTRAVGRMHAISDDYLGRVDSNRSHINIP